MVLAVYWRFSHRVQNRLLLVASYVFYGWWDWRFLILILFSITVAFTAGRLIDRSDSPTRRKRLLLFSLVANLGLLGFFK